MKTKSLLLILMLVFILSCKKDEKASLGGDQSPIGAVDNAFTINAVPGITNFNAKVTSLESGVSTITYSATIAGTTATTILSALTGATVTGNSFTRVSKYKITTNGIQSNYTDGDLILVKYDAKVGDKWSLKVSGNEITRTVTSVSNTDDYTWNGMLIKVIKVDETGRGLPGVAKLEFIANHKFGLVGIIVHLEDGSTQNISIISTAVNP